MIFEESKSREQESTHRADESIYSQQHEASYDEDLAAEFYIDEFNEMVSFDNVSSTPNSNTTVIAKVPRGSSSRKPAEMGLAVVSRNSRAAADDQIWSIETATQRLIELNMGGTTSEPTVVYGRTEDPYTCAWMHCRETSPPELQLPSGMEFYCPGHYRPGSEPDVWRMQCVGRTKRGLRCGLRDYRVLHPAVNAYEYRCQFHWSTKRGLLFRASPLYNFEQHHVSLSSSVGIAHTLLKGKEQLESFFVKDARDSYYIHVTLNGWHRSIFSKQQFDELTQGFDNVLKENIRRLVVDYFRLLEAGFHQDRRLAHSGSIISWRYQYDKRAGLITECLKRGSVYFLLYDMANLTCEKPLNGIAIKIGNTQELRKRAGNHLAQCQIPIARQFLFPEKGGIPFVYLLEEIVHEMLRAHQHDIACPCGATHTELYWFSGHQQNQENLFDAVVRILRPIIHHWITAIQNLQWLHSELQDAHFSTPL